MSSSVWLMPPGEVALWRELREKAEADAAHEMSMRGMAEAQCLFVMSEL